MNSGDNETHDTQENLTYWARHRYMLLIALTIVISLILVTVGLYMYNVSGTAQLDLSRPDFQRAETPPPSVDKTFEGYSASGDINLSSIEEFKELYDDQAQSATAVDAFSGDPLSPDALKYSVATE